APKRRGRPPKAKVEAAAPKRRGRPPKQQAATNGKRISVSPATARAERAATRAKEVLKGERQKLAAAKERNVEARTKWRATRSATDKAAVKRARVTIKRITSQVAKARDKARTATTRAIELQSADRLSERIRTIEAGLERANAVAATLIDARVQRATETYARNKRAQVERVEARKAKKRAVAAEKAIAELRSGKPRKRKRRARTSKSDS
ncbi:MAG: hypothetical protein J4F45_02940, partial [Pseudomonadales bacterium]|nr:hypothetical protein [Pseudomonadales bacterium]